MAETPSTVEIAIAHPERGNEPCIIPAADFDETKHVRWEHRASELAAQEEIEKARAEAEAKQRRLETAMAVPLTERKAKAVALLAPKAAPAPSVMPQKPPNAPPVMKAEAFADQPKED